MYVQCTEYREQISFDFQPITAFHGDSFNFKDVIQCKPCVFVLYMWIYICSDAGTVTVIYLILMKRDK